MTPDLEVIYSILRQGGAIEVRADHPEAFRRVMFWHFGTPTLLGGVSHCPDPGAPMTPVPVLVCGVEIERDPDLDPGEIRIRTPGRTPRHFRFAP